MRPLVVTYLQSIHGDGSRVIERWQGPMEELLA